MLIIWIDPRVNDQELDWVVAKFDGDDDNVYLIHSQKSHFTSGLFQVPRSYQVKTSPVSSSAQPVPV